MERTHCDQKAAVNRGRHAKSCSICKHPQCDQIEADFLGWRSPVQIARTYHLSDRSSVYRHAHAFGLFVKRRRNVRAALEHIIERAGEVEVSAAAVIAAVQAYSKINAQGQWVERSERVNVHELFDRMSHAELEDYAQNGKLPSWFSQSVATTDGDSLESLND